MNLGLLMSISFLLYACCIRYDTTVVELLMRRLAN